MKAALLMIAVVLAMAGCGDGAGDPERDAVRGTIEGYFHATARGDGATACASLTEQARQSFAALLDVPPARDCEANVRKVARRSLPIRAVHVNDLLINGDRATAYVTADRPAYSSSEVLVRESGSWACRTSCRDPQVPATAHRAPPPRSALVP